MPVNVWSAGRDELLGFLAERDALKRLTEDRERRDRLDTEAASDRQRMRSIQDAQQRSLDEDRDERRRMMGDAAKAKSDAAKAGAAQEAEISAALQTFATTQDDQERMAAAAVLDRYKVDPKAINAIRNPKPDGTGFTLSPGQRRFDAKGQMVASAPDRPSAGPAAPKPVTPQQRLAAKLQAQRMAQMAERNMQIPEGVSASEYAQQLEDEYLSTLGVDVPARAPKPSFASGPITGVERRNTSPDINLSAPSAGPAAPPTAAPAQSDENEILQTAHALVSNALKKNATPEQVQKFLSDPNNIAEIKKMLAGGR